MKKSPEIKIVLMTLALSTLSPALEPPKYTFKQDALGYKLEWSGAAGMSYFIEYSEALNSWRFLPEIKQGVGSFGYGFLTSDTKLFTRVIVTNVPMDNPETYDLDGDGLGNMVEINATPQTSPLNWDTDGDGMNDGWEVLMNFDPTVAGTGGEDPTADGDSDNYTNLMESLLGLNPAVGIESATSSEAALEIYTPN